MRERTAMKRAKTAILSLSLLAGLLRVAAVDGHDLWTVPGRFNLSPGERCRVFINSGDEFPKSDSLLGAHRVASFRMLSSAGEEELSDFVVDGRSLTVELPPMNEGTVVLALGTKPRLVRLKANEFNEYLKEDGLPQILVLREQRGEMEQAVVERYAKWAKAILRVGDGEKDDIWSRPAGLKMEIVPLNSPYQLDGGGELAAVTLFEGEPVAGLTVTATRAGGPRNEVAGVTDERGQVTLSLLEPGRWSLHTIHMVSVDEDPEADWESFWATLTFELLP